MKPRTRLRAGLLALLSASAWSCKEPGPCFVGDPDADPELVIVHVHADGTVEDTDQDDEVPIVKPPQGGKILVIGARARNLDGCPVTLTVALRDECTGRIIGSDGRRVLLRPNGQGWLEAQDVLDLADVANVSACPSAAAERDIEGELYRLEVQLEDAAGRTAQAAVRVKPVCSEPAFLEECSCECSKGYRLGDRCEPDEGPGLPPGTCPDPSDGGT